MLKYLFLAGRNKNQNSLLLLKISEQFVFLILLLSLLGGCNPITTLQLPSDTPSLATRMTPFPTLTSTEVLTIAPAQSEMVPLIGTITPFPISTTTAVPTITSTSTQTEQLPDGDSQLITFTSFRDGYFAIYTVDMRNSSTNRLVSNTVNGFSPQWSPNGKMLGFLSVATNDNSQVLILLDVESGNLFQSEINHITSFSWSPDSQFVVFASNELISGNRYRTYTMSVPDLQLHVLYESDVPVLDIQWSPAGDQILNLALLEQVQLRFVYILNLMGNVEELLLKGSPMYLDWAPTGQQIAYDNMFFPAFEQQELRVISVDGTDDHGITELGRFSHDPQWSPDGNMIAYQSYDIDTNPSINILDLKSNKTFQISPNGLSSWYPSWSPNGRQVAFLVETSSVDETGFSLYIFFMDTGQTSQIVSDFVSPYRPAWQP